MTTDITQTDVDELTAALHTAVDATVASWYAALTPPPPPPPPVTPLTATVVTAPGQAVVTWTPNPALTPASFAVGRDGTDTAGTGPWSTTDPATARTRTFDRLIGGETYTITVQATYTDGTSETASVQATPAAPTPPDPPADPITWASGAFTDHDPSVLAAMGTWRGRAMGVATVYPSRGGTAALENTWWIGAAGAAPAIAVGVPMALDGGSIATDLSSSLTKMAAAMKADGRQYYIRLGWEMNLGGWAWKVTDANLPQWRSRWSQYYAIFKNALGAKGLVGFNPNGGGDQSGISGGVLRAWVDGQVDWCGPDQYDCYPPFSTDANVAIQHAKTGGLDFWASTARAKGVRLAVPEWGVSSGTQWAPYAGGDNPRYVTEMIAWMEANADIMAFDSYFNEPAAYVASAIYPASTNPKAAAAYQSAHAD